MREIKKNRNGLYRRGLVIAFALIGGILVLRMVVEAAANDQPRTGGTSANPIVVIAPNEVERWLRVGNETGPRNRWQRILDELTSPVSPDALGRRALELTPENVRLLNRAGMRKFLAEALRTTPKLRAPNVPPVVIVMDPAAGSFLGAEVAIVIQWIATDMDGHAIDSVDVFASFDNQVTYSRITPTLPGTTTGMNWIIPNRPGPAWIKVEATDTFGSTGACVTNFTIQPLSLSRGGLVQTTLTDFFQPGTQPFDHIVDFRNPNTDCATCHGDVVNDDGGASEADPYFYWRGTMMANASYDPLFEACLAIAEQDAPGSGDLCLRCHIPHAWLNGRSTPTSGSAVLDTDRHGVSCDICHRMVDPIAAAENPAEDVDILANLDARGFLPAYFGTGRSVLDPNGLRRGPTDPALLADLKFRHAVVESPFHREAAICGTCHNVSNPVFENDGSGNYVLNALDTATTDFSPGNVAPIERTYSEWLASDFNTPGGVDTPAFGGFVSTCQDCHMRDVGGQSCNLGNTRPDMPQHDLTGGSTWMMGEVLPAIFRALDQQFDDTALLNAATRAYYMLFNAADLKVVVDGDQLKVTVTNLTGHKLPTGYPDGRRMWIYVAFRGSDGASISESGAYNTFTGVLTHDPEVKIYESQPGPSDAVAALTGLPATHGFHFVLNNKIYKDNRIPPRGFTNAAYAAFGGAPVAYSYADGEYWDDTFYTIPPCATVAEVHLQYQSTSKEYIEFLRDANTTNTKGNEMYALWNDHNKCPPVSMAVVSVIIPDGDTDEDGVGNRCDNCPDDANTTAQSHFLHKSVFGPDRYPVFVVS